MPRGVAWHTTRAASGGLGQRSGGQLVEQFLAGRHDARLTGEPTDPGEGVADILAGQNRPVRGGDHLGAQRGDRVDVAAVAVGIEPLVPISVRSRQR